MSQFAFFAALLGLLAIAFAVSAIWQKSRGLALALALGLPLAAEREVPDLQLGEHRA